MKMGIFLAVVIAGALLINIVSFCARNLPPPSAAVLPEQYKDYQYIHEITETENYSVTCYEAGSADPVFFNNSGDGVIIALYEKDGDDSVFTYQVLNNSGNVVDSLILPDYPKDKISGYLFYENYYVSWYADGDKSRQAFKRVDQEPGFNPDARDETLAAWYRQSEMVENDVLSGEWKDKTNSVIPKIYRFYFFRNGKWWFLDTYNPDNFDWYPAKNIKYGFPGVYVPKQTIATFFDQGDYGKLRTEAFYLAHFQREEYRKRTRVSPWSPTGGAGYPPRWMGTGFIDLKLRGDTLRLKKSMVEVIDDLRSYSFPVPLPLELYAPENFNFYVITESQGGFPPSIKLYLIKPKK